MSTTLEKPKPAKAGGTTTVPAGILATALAAATRATQNGNLQVLSHVLLTWQDGMATVTGTDMERATRVDFPVSGGVGRCVAPAATLLDAAKRQQATAPVSLTASADGLAVACGKFKAALRCLDVGEFPAMNIGELPTAFSMPAAMLREMLDATAFCASPDETRFYLQGVYLHVREGRLVAAATDGNKLSRIAMPLPEGAADMPGIIIPSKTVAEISRLLEGATGDVRVETSSMRLVVSHGATRLTSKLIDGNFPDIERVIPRDNAMVLLVRKKEIIRAIEAVAGLQGSVGAVIITATESGVTVSATDTELGTAADEMEGAVWEGADLRIAYAPKNILPICSALSDRLELRFAGDAAPAVITDLDRPEVLYVTMSMRA